MKILPKVFRDSHPFFQDHKIAMGILALFVFRNKIGNKQVRYAIAALFAARIISAFEAGVRAVIITSLIGFSVVVILFRKYSQYKIDYPHSLNGIEFKNSK